MLKNIIHNLLEKKLKIKNNYLPTKKFWKPKIVDIKSVIKGHSKTSHKLSKTKKVGYDSPLYSDAKKVKIF